MSARTHIGTVLICSVLVTAARPDVITYEAETLPEDVGWERLGTMDAERWLDGGWFFQHVELGDWGPPPGGQQDTYQRSLREFIGEERFFMEWRMQTDGDRSEIPGTAPSSLVASGTTGVNYHFTIAQDQVRFIRDVRLPILYIDIEPGVPHTYRVELYTDEFYMWFIDGDVVDSGLPEGAYPTSDSNFIGFRAKFWYLENVTQWDYIRFGTIPIEGSGDFDSDGNLDSRDWYFFEECLQNGGADVDAGPGCLWADMDQDGDVDFHDFALFQLAFTGP